MEAANRTCTAYAERREGGHDEQATNLAFLTEVPSIRIYKAGQGESPGRANTTAPARRKTTTNKRVFVRYLVRGISCT